MIYYRLFPNVNLLKYSLVNFTLLHLTLLHEKYLSKEVLIFDKMILQSFKDAFLCVSLILHHIN